MGSVAFWTASEDGSSWYRADQPAEALRWNGHQAWASELLPQSVFQRAQTIVGSRVCTESATETWRAITETGKRMVLDLDDDYFNVDPSNPAAKFWLDDKVLARLAYNCTVSDLVTCASDRIAASVIENTGQTSVRVIENGLHSGYLSIPRNYDPDVITIGWAGSLATTVDIDLIERPARRIAAFSRTFPNANLAVRFKFVGLHHDHIPRWVHELGETVPVEILEWAWPNGRYLSEVSAFDIWLAPYRSNKFVDAKFPTKALEAGFLGIPLLASDIRPYQEWATGSPILIDEAKPWGWSHHIKNLVESPALRQAEGEKARSESSRNILQSLVFQWEEVIFGD